jgi:hypothetical protein
MRVDTPEAEFDEYSEAREQFEKRLDEWQAESAQALEHGDLEARVEQEGTERLRRLLQGSLEQRARSEERLESVTGRDGMEHCPSRERRRKLATLFGEVEVQRLGYSGPGLESIFPLDEALNLPPDKYSHGLRRKVGLEVAKGAFGEAVDAIAEGSGGKVPKRQAEQVSRALSVDFETYYRRQSVEPGEGLLVMTVDGKGIVVRHEDLRKATRQAAEASTHKLKTRLSRGEKRHRKRMATVASVYDVAPPVRTAESIMGQDERPGERPKPSHKRVWASVRQEPAQVIEPLFAEAERRDPEHERPWRVRVDGQESQWREVSAAIARHRPDAGVIQDFVPVLEYLWKAAYCFYEEGSEQAEAWVQSRAIAVLQSQVSDVAAGMRRSATRQGLSQEARRPVDQCANYLLKNKARLDDATALANGWPIGTGVIEGACRYRVKDRMEITGARWSLDGAEAVLRLRSLRASGDFEDSMAFHPN